MAEDQQDETYSEKYIYMFMDAAGRGLPVDASTVAVTDMQMRHNAFEVEMTEAAQELLGEAPPIGDPVLVHVIEDIVKRVRSGESLKCKTTFPEAAMGILWAWHIVTRFHWEWRAVKKDWWETLAIADTENKYVILPVQFMRGVADNEEVERWPHDIIEAIENGQLPDSNAGDLLRIC
ncbi:hypothetical protein LOC71_18925 [Rhodopirellula sp. JC740]|uniref:DUF3806 domain-containing protein n=1 Tax=Rhodopirellula halodulae TaxID=2894198 RepID=A0ABS8NLA4_9BACT|nr:hypothetical protein [Rhodopirellula sp. JC740]MCC9644356.1 hypothetical protein [Rhodopirellula sp. JC740]